MAGARRLLPHELRPSHALPLLSEQISYKRYLTLWDRQVEFPNGRRVHWDVTGHSTPNPTFATVFPFNTKTKNVSAILWEYAQGPNDMAYSLVAGGFDPKKHTSIRQTAQFELSEEAHLKDGQWIPLIDEKSQGLPELKWSRNLFMPYLVLDPTQDLNPKDRDPEELIDIVSEVSLDELKSIILQGRMMLPSVQTCLMALDWLKLNGHLSNDHTLL